MSFFFTRLGVALGVFGDFLPLVGDFVFTGYGLSVVIGELSPFWASLLLGLREKLEGWQMYGLVN